MADATIPPPAANKEHVGIGNVTKYEQIGIRKCYGHENGSLVYVMDVMLQPIWSTRRYQTGEWQSREVCIQHVH